MTSDNVNVGGEFALIRQFFMQKTHHNPHVDLGVGDDGALFRIATHQQCVVSSDLLISGRHFFADTAPYGLGHKALAVNLSDLAAMAAEPLAFTLSLGLPRRDEAWLSQFSAGLYDLAQTHRCDLIGGDTTHSEQLVINITVLGQVPTGQAVRRDGAQVGDDVWVSGELGSAAYALHLLQTNPSSAVLSSIRHRLELPTPRIALGLALRGVATAMLDLSDGLAGDLTHILRASHCGVQINCDALPLAEPLLNLPRMEALTHAVAGGDDYELCFTAPAAARDVISDLGRTLQLPLTRIGCVVNGEPDVEWCSTQVQDLSSAVVNWAGFNHFP